MEGLHLYIKGGNEETVSLDLCKGNKNPPTLLVKLIN